MENEQKQRLKPLTDARRYKDIDIDMVHNILNQCQEYKENNYTSLDFVLKAYHIAELKRQNNLLVENGNYTDIAILEICKQLQEIKDALIALTFK